MSRLMILRSKWKVLSYKDGCIWNTKEIGEEWVDINDSKNTSVVDANGIFYGSISTDRMKELNYVITKRVKV